MAKVDGRGKGGTVISAIMTAISLMALVAVLKYLNLSLIHGVGYSAIIFASFGGSAFLLFMMPNEKASDTRRFVKSYIIGGVIGVISSFILQYLGVFVAVGISIFVASVLFAKTDSMHPPGIGLVFAFILYKVDYPSIILVVAGVAIMVVVKLFLEKAAFIIEKDIERSGKKAGR